MNTAHLTIAQINHLTREQFVRVLGPVFESSPWIADAAWLKLPFTSLDHLHRALCDVVIHAGEAKQIQLIQAHPDLAGPTARTGLLTAESAREQASAGLDSLSREEGAVLQEYNRQYRQTFGFPFVICARLNQKESILAAFKSRLRCSRSEEIKTALDEISKIARLRLEALVGG